MISTRIRFPDGEEWDLRRLYDDPPRRNEVLRKFHRAKERPRCLCGADTQVELIVRRLEGNFRLACYPGTTSAHDPRCYFYSPDEGRVGQVYTLDAVEHLSDGGLFIRLDQSLSSNGQRAGVVLAADHKASSRHGASQVKRNTVKLLGLLQILWERAGLHRWQPRAAGDNRRYTEIVDQLTDAAVDVRLPAGDLLSRFYVPPPTYDSAGTELKATLARAGNQQAIVVVGEFLSSRGTNFGEAVALVCLKNCPLYFPGELWTRLLNSYRRPQRTEDERFWMIAICTLSPAGHINVKDAAWMECQRNYIVVHSAHERRVADRLVLQGRTFFKPLRYDTSEEDAAFPDFVLTDVGGEPMPMEVWGLNTPDYLQRRREKTLKYGARLWEWDVFTENELRPFPPRA